MTIVATAPRLGHLERRTRRLPRLLAGAADRGPAGLNQHERRFGALPLPEAAWNGDRAAARRAASRLIAEGGAVGAGGPRRRRIPNRAQAALRGRGSGTGRHRGERLGGRAGQL